MNKLLAILIALGLFGCAKPVAVVSTSHSFMTEAFFVLEFEHDAKGVLVHAVSYGPTFKEQDCLNSELMYQAKARQYNPPGFISQFTCEHVMFRGPVGPRGAVIAQPTARPPTGWVLFATDFSAHGQYIGAEMLHSVADLSACQHDARAVIDSNPDAIPPGASLLIYCVPVPPLPTATTLPNGDSII